MTTLFTFPGQGAQRAGMLHALPQAATVRDTLAEASDTLGQVVLALDTESALQSSVAVQLALLCAGVAMGRHLIEVAGAPAAVAGLSIGAYPVPIRRTATGRPDPRGGRSACRINRRAPGRSTIDDMAYNKDQWIASFEGQLAILRPHLTERVLTTMSLQAWNAVGTDDADPVAAARELSKLLDQSGPAAPRGA